MDIETTMKINTLAKELLNKGLAPSSEEASVLAEQMLQKEIPKTSPEADKDQHLVAMERLQRSVNNDMTELKEQVMSLTSQLSQIKEDIRMIKQNKPEKPIPKIEEKQEQLVNDKPKETPPQRTGDFKPGDVDIDKIFYYGNK